MEMKCPRGEIRDCADCGTSLGEASREPNSFRAQRCEPCGIAAAARAWREWGGCEPPGWLTAIWRGEEPAPWGTH
jgi:hypothetical protein